MRNRERAKLLARRALLESELEERKRSLPAHSVRPHQILAVEDLEEEIAELDRKLDGEN